MQEIEDLLDKEDIIIGKEYVVVAITSRSNYVEYAIYEEDGYLIPMFYPIEYFSIIDSRLSRYWHCTTREYENGEKYLFFGFSEWVNDECYYGRMADGYEEELGVFSNYRKLMDLEFPNNTITERAQIGDEKWLICPLCMDAWEYPDDKDAMVVCPICQKMQHNPRYKNTM